MRGTPARHSPSPNLSEHSSSFRGVPNIDALENLEVSFDSWSRSDDGDFGPEHWRLTVSVDLDADQPESTAVLRMDGWTYPLSAGMDLSGELDGYDPDAAVFVPLVEGDDLADDLDVEGFGSRLVLINRVSLAREWRGLGGVGRYLTGLAISRIIHDAACVALHASPFELPAQYPDSEVPGEEWENGAVKLGRLWESLGFSRHSGHLYVLDPNTVTLDQKIAEWQSSIRQRSSR